AHTSNTAQADQLQRKRHACHPWATLGTTLSASGISMSRPVSALHTAVAAARDKLRETHPRITELFAADPERQARYSLEAGGIHYDFSREWLDDAARGALWELARGVELPQAIAALFAGEPVNNTEARPALHVALRSPR